MLALLVQRVKKKEGLWTNANAIERAVEGVDIGAWLASRTNDNARLSFGIATTHIGRPVAENFYVCVTDPKDPLGAAWVPKANAVRDVSTICAVLLERLNTPHKPTYPCSQTAYPARSSSTSRRSTSRGQRARRATTPTHAPRRSSSTSGSGGLTTTTTTVAAVAAGRRSPRSPRDAVRPRSVARPRGCHLRMRLRAARRLHLCSASAQRAAGRKPTA